jgi:hypothetical protein
MGSDKAGSTAIQESLYANLGWYGEQGYHVSTVGLTRAGGHPHLFSRLGDSDLVDDLRAEPNDGAATVLLSWEGVHFFDVARQELLRAVLAQAYPRAGITFVYYVRNQVDLVQSGLLQQIKQLSLPPRTVLDVNRPLALIPDRSRPLLEPQTRLFHRRIEEWRSTFPSAQFVVRLYDRARLHRGDAVDDFHEVVGLGDRTGFRRAVGAANESLSAEAAVVLDRVFGRIQHEEDRQRAIDVLSCFDGGSGAYLHEDTRRAITDRYRDDNARLVAAFPHCAGIDAPRSEARPDIDQEAVAECERFLLDHGPYPTIWRGRCDLAALALPDGWGHPGDDGVWATGPRSVIRFRPRGAHFTGFSDGVEIALKVRYAGPRALTDDVIVNEHRLGPHDLGRRSLFVDRALLDHTYRVEIVLEHAPGRGRHDDDRTLLLRSFSYSVR